MESAYHAEAWKDLYVMLGGSSAALIGLFFVAASIHLTEILRVPYLRIFARNNTIAMIESLVKAAVILIPQSLWLLAVELLAIHVFGCLTVVIALARDSRHAPPARKIPIVLLGVAILLGIASAVSLMLQSGGGMYLVTASYLLFLCIAISSAWALMVGIYRAKPVGEAA
jgi:hypothetical protein